MNKKLIKLTESDLHKIVNESVRRVLNENDGYDENNDTNWSWKNHRDKIPFRQTDTFAFKYVAQDLEEALHIKRQI